MNPCNTGEMIVNEVIIVLPCNECTFGLFPYLKFPVYPAHLFCLYVYLTSIAIA